MSQMPKAILYWFDSTEGIYKPINSEGENINPSVPKVELYWYDILDDSYKPLITDGKMPVTQDVIDAVTQSVQGDISTLDTKLTETTNKVPWRSILDYEHLKIAVEGGWDWTNAYKAALTDSNVKLVLPATTSDHIISSPVDVGNRQTIIGAGMDNTRIKYVGTTGACFQAPASQQREFLTFRDFRITGTATSGILIDMKNMVSSLIDSCYLTTSASSIVRFHSQGGGLVGYYNGLINSVLYNTTGTGKVIAIENAANSTKVAFNRISGGQYTLHVTGSDNAMVIGNSFESTGAGTVSLLYTTSWKTQVLGNRFEMGGTSSSNFIAHIATGATYADLIGNFYSGTLAPNGSLSFANYIKDEGVYSNILENQWRQQKAFAPFNMNGNLLTAKGGILLESGDLDGGGRTLRGFARVDIPAVQPGNPIDGTVYVDRTRNRLRFYEDGEWRYTNTFTHLDTLPAATENNRGWSILVKGAVGVADRIYVCVKTSADTYIWKEL